MKGWMHYNAKRRPISRLQNSTVNFPTKFPRFINSSRYCVSVDEKKKKKITSEHVDDSRESDTKYSRLDTSSSQFTRSLHGRFVPRVSRAFCPSWRDSKKVRTLWISTRTEERRECAGAKLPGCRLMENRGWVARGERQV